MFCCENAFTDKFRVMITNEELQKNVQDALKWEPLLKAAEIGVTVEDGVVTLTGAVDSYAKKLEAEDAAKSIAGVKAVIEKIEIQFGSTWYKSGSEIAIEVLDALNANWEIPNDKVKVKIEDGWVTLDGELSWNYQKQAAKTSIRNLMGVKGVTNNITIRPETQDIIEKRDIEKALARNWSINEQDVQIAVKNNEVTITGTVSSLYQKNQAERIVWNAPGVCSVVNELVIEYDFALSE